MSIKLDLDWLEVLTEDFNSARSLTVCILVRYCEWDQLVNLRCYPSDYCTLTMETGVFSTTPYPFSTIDEFRFDYQISELLRKCSDLPLKEADPSGAALQSFWDAEYQCANTNIRLNQLMLQHRDWFIPAKRIDSRWQEVVKVWRRIVREVLGPLPLDLTPKFSSGATFDDRRYKLPQDKMSSRPTVTAEAFQIIEPFWGKTLWSRGLCQDKPNRSSPKIILGDRFTMVPKTALTHRGICVGPSLNVTYQLSVGKHIRKRLSIHGIDLTYGQAVHQRLAEEASMTLEMATIDLSSASDTVSAKLVELILPGDWFDLLDSLRCKQTRVDGKWRKLSKFSAMGNGYTFELETLLFYTLSLTVAELCNHSIRNLKVFGDDIIVDSAIAGKLVNALRFFGFIINPRKTFLDDTPFRESCGGDYYLGHNVRGYYLDKLPTEPIDWIKLANGIRRMANPDLHAFNDSYCYKRCWLRIISRIPKSIRRCRGPESYGDLCLHDERSRWHITWKRGEKHISVYQPVFSDDSNTSYDRKFWSRDSIVAAATLGLLHNASDSHILTHKGTWKTIPGRQKVADCPPIGYEVKHVVLSDVAGSVSTPFSDKLLEIVKNKPYAYRRGSAPRISNYWLNWLLS